MDDYLIIDTNKDKLKIIWKYIEEELGKLKLITNKKSNIYRLSIGIIFLGYKYRYINNRLVINFNKKTYKKINKKLNSISNLIKYKRVYASYYGYYKRIKKLEEYNFKMKLEEVYNEYKKDNRNSLIIIKDGIFYNSYNEDGIIMWYIFNYKYINNKCSFGSSPYFKVLDKLKKLDISFIVIDKEKELVKYNGSDNVYDSYLLLSKNGYDKYLKEEELIMKVKDIYHKDYHNYDKIMECLNKI